MATTAEVLERVEVGCPFCGVPARVEDGEHELNVKLGQYMGVRGVPHFGVQCIMCGATGPLSVTEMEAVEEWNRRAGV